MLRRIPSTDLLGSSINLSDGEEGAIRAAAAVAAAVGGTKEPPEHSMTGHRMDRRRAKSLQVQCKRLKIVKEMVETEESYVNTLETIIHVFMGAISRANESARVMGSREPVLSKTDLMTIFSNIEGLLMLNQHLLEGLKKRLENWVAHEGVGDVFLDFGPYFKLYTLYIQNFSTALTTLDNKMKQSEEFATIITTCEQNPRCSALGLRSLLLEPVQRIPRYKLLLESYLKHTPPHHFDHADAEKSVRLVSDVAEHVNEAVRKQENFKRLLALQSSFVVTSKVACVFQPGRWLIREGDLNELMVPRGSSSSSSTAKRQSTVMTLPSQSSKGDVNDGYDGSDEAVSVQAAAKASPRRSFDGSATSSAAGATGGSDSNSTAYKSKARRVYVFSDGFLYATRRSSKKDKFLPIRMLGFKDLTLYISPAVAEAIAPSMPLPPTPSASCSDILSAANADLPPPPPPPLDLAAAEHVSFGPPELNGDGGDGVAPPSAHDLSQFEALGGVVIQRLDAAPPPFVRSMSTGSAGGGASGGGGGQGDSVPLDDLSFEVCSPECPHPVRFSASSPEELQAWVSTVRGALVDYRKRVSTLKAAEEEEEAVRRTKGESSSASRQSDGAPVAPPPPPRTHSLGSAAQRPSSVAKGGSGHGGAGAAGVGGAPPGLEEAFRRRTHSAPGSTRSPLPSRASSTSSAASAAAAPKPVGPTGANLAAFASAIAGKAQQSAVNRLNDMEDTAL